jgi:chromosome segregation ATPase
LGADYNHKV